ncbi:hypothetical protein BJN34_12980 [Cupriavidus necator]|uniref:Uncharacterized protein n=2 Tax=Cupriavidus necator TaxID=106590 RepID=A0A1U9URN7_CUPNE|nr:hypothetical protein BJN34_12980 [Cupriavidus necator]
MHLLPGRSDKSIVAKALDLKLGRRGCGQMPGNSMTWRTIQRLLSGGSMLSDKQLAEKSGLSRRYIAQEIRAHYPACLHVGDYGPKTGTGPAPRLWALGPGKDADRPPAMTGAQRARKRWRHLKANRPEYLDKRNARDRLKYAEKAGKLIRRDPAAAWF